MFKALRVTSYFYISYPVFGKQVKVCERRESGERKLGERIIFSSVWEERLGGEEKNVLKVVFLGHYKFSPGFEGKISERWCTFNP